MGRKPISPVFQRSRFISESKQKANVTVDEDGTEASAATYVKMLPLSAHPDPPPPPPRKFIANRPFLFVVRETEFGLILFIGRVSNPTRK